ncbi:hypothetical protein [Streptomyces sp. NPDC089799]|uniref:hypothetical protein n=1 Tax=Streptomyces sp. NPDC089799 TaxID=3155066 RepID=UPI00342CCA3D
MSVLMSRVVLAVMAAAVACVPVLVFTPAVEAAGPGPDGGGDLLVFSNDAYTKHFGEQLARAAGVEVPQEPLARVAGVRDPQQPWHKVNWSVRDWDGNDIPTRHGTDDFGWLHASSKHNMYSAKAINAPYDGTADKVTGTRVEYWGVVATNQGQVRMRTVSVAERGTRGPAGKPTPDGRPIGTMTAYCLGQTVCPDWVNDL